MTQVQVACCFLLALAFKKKSKRLPEAPGELFSGRTCCRHGDDDRANALIDPASHDSAPFPRLRVVVGILLDIARPLRRDVCVLENCGHRTDGSALRAIDAASRINE